MPPRNHRKWLATPNVEYVSSEIYSSQQLFEEEQEKIAKEHGYKIVDHKLVLYVKPIDGEK